MPEGGWEPEESRTTWPRLARSKRPECLQEPPTSPGDECRAPEDSRPASQTVAAQVRVPCEPSSFFSPRSGVACAPGQGEARGGSAAGCGSCPGARTAGSGVQPLPGDRCGCDRAQTRVHSRGGHTPKQHSRAVDPQN